jgi:hypothetical protein
MNHSVQTNVAAAPALIMESIVTNKQWHRALALFGVLVTVVCLFSTAANAQLTFTAEAINGKVVDEETGAPLAGVIIVAKWTVEESFVGRNNDLLNVLETISDKDGNYGFPAWGPKLLPIFPLSPLAIFGSGNDPMVVYFKSGYWPAQEKNEVTYAERLEGVDSRKTPLGSFQANGKTIKLKKWDGKDEERYYERVSAMVNELHGGWKKYPRMTLAIDRIYQPLLQREKRKDSYS